MLRLRKHCPGLTRLGCINKATTTSIKKNLPIKRIIAKKEAWENAKPFKQIPSPKSYPFIGNALEYSSGSLKGLSMPQILRKLTSEYGNICKLHGLFGNSTVLVFHPADMEKVYRTEGIWPWRKDTECLTYFRRHFRPDIYKNCIGLSVSQGRDWQSLRSMANPVLMKPRMLNQYISSMEEVTDEFIAKMLRIRDGQDEMPEDFYNEMNKWALESTALVAMDTKLGCLRDDLRSNSDPQMLIQSILEFFELAFKIDVLPSPWKYISTPDYRRTMKVLDTMTRISLKYVNESTNNIRLNGENRTITGEDSVLEKLLKNNRNTALIMVTDLLLGGVDTVSSSCALFLYNIANNERAQKLLREELRTVLPNKNSSVTSETLKRLPYLRACIKESARLSPITIGNMRRTGDDIILSGFQVPKGTDVLLCHSIAQHSNIQFQDPQKFLPERWLSKTLSEYPLLNNGENITLRSAKDAHKFSFMPFGFGPRSCVGKRFADLEMEIFLMKLLRNYHIEWKYGEMQYKTSFINTPASTLKFKMTEVP